MATILRDGNLGLLDGKVAVIGYGSQGHAHALNLRDSGVQVEVGLREGSPSWGEAEATGLTVRTVAEAVAGAQLVSILLPDQVQPQVFTEHIEPNLAPFAPPPLAAIPDEDAAPARDVTMAIHASDPGQRAFA